MTRDNTKNLQLNKPGLFTPSIVRGVRQGASHQSVNFGTEDNQLNNSTIGTTSSFKYDVDETGLKSTQQLNIDWSKFENHTFFNSAQVKTNVALDKIFNEFPFDGTKEEFEAFFANLTGFEKWVYDQFPKTKRYLFFSGSSEDDPDDYTGTFVRTKDLQGAQFPTIAKTRTGQSVIGPGSNPLTIEMHLYVASQSNSASVVLDKHVDNGPRNLHGFYLALEPTGSVSTGSLSFYIFSGSVNDRVVADVNKGQWNHLAWTWNRTPGLDELTAYVNQKPVASSSQKIDFGFIDTTAADFLIGSGSAFDASSSIGVFNGSFEPKVSFSGAMDELRVWHSVRSSKQRANFAKKAVFADDDLKLYYKFNEPADSKSRVVLDHSSNALHGNLSPDARPSGRLDVRNVPTSSVAGPTPMKFEKRADTPVLFPDHPGIIDLQSKLLSSASQYDDDNPNIITRLVPVHYFLEGQQEDALESELGEIAEGLQGGSDPRSSTLGATQVLLLLLYTWAKFFDELKLYIQAFSTLNHVDYDFTDTVPDQFLQTLARQEGIELPPLFDGSSIEQFIEAENIQSDISTNDISLQAIRNQIWRRILINLQDVIRSKGTMHSVKSFIRAAGINPDNNFRIREYGGPTSRPLSFVRDKRNEISTMINFVSGGLLQSPFLSSSRTEPGFPEPSGDASDGLLTSGSWTYEAFYRFLPSSIQETTQSLVQMRGTGSFGGSLFANLVSVHGGNTTLFVRPNSGSSAPTLSLSVTGADLFDGDQWYVSFGRRRNDDGLQSEVSSSYFLRVAKQNFGEILETKTTASFFDETAGAGEGNNVWNNLLASPSGSNVSGSFFTISGSSVDTSLSIHLNTSSVTPAAHATDFYGKVGHIRFYTKYLTEKEWKEHVRYYRSVGVQDPDTNFNFVTNVTGSFQKLRVDASTDQPVTRSNGSGEILLTDFSQHGFGLTGSNFPTTSSVIQPERFFFSYISPKFDQAATTEKVRIRSFQNFSDVEETDWAEVAPVHDIEPSEQPTDNTRFTIDFSVTDALDQDIITMFSTLDELDNAIGDPQLMFSPDYPGLDELREVYFNKLVDKMQLKRFFEFFKWFDTNIGTFVEQLIPRKTTFLGTNFVIENHMLERPKVEYNFADIYLGDNLRHHLKDTILLQLITGDFSRY